VTAEATPPPPRRSRAWRWGLGLVLTMMVALGLVLLFLLAQATGNRELYERNYTRLLVLNIAVATLLLAVIVLVAVRLVTRLRRGKFGSRLLIKLAAIFALVGFVPGMLIYVVSYQFVSRSIESWFDVKVEGALDAGLSLGRTTLDTLSTELTAKVRVATTQLGDVSDGASPLALERLREQLSASDVVLWTASGQLIASAGAVALCCRPNGPPQPSCAVPRVRNAASRRSKGWTRPAARAPPVTKARIGCWRWSRNPAGSAGNEPRFLQVIQPLPPALVANALAVHRGQPRVPGACAGPPGAAAHVHRHPDAQPVPGRLWRRAAGGVAGQPAGAPAAGAGRGRARGGAGDLTPKAALPRATNWVA
jgi:nitrogen fixation/metabolism regulation signal transduction histidine kinase